MSDFECADIVQSCFASSIAGAACGAACLSASHPLFIQVGAQVLAACGHGAAYNVSTLTMYKAMAPSAAIIGSALGCFSGCIRGTCGSNGDDSDDSDDKSNSCNDLIYGALTTAASGSLGAHLSAHTSLNAAQGAAAGATGVGVVAAGFAGIAVAALVVGGTCYCFVAACDACKEEVVCIDLCQDKKVTKQEIANNIIANGGSAHSVDLGEIALSLANNENQGSAVVTAQPGISI